MQGVCMIERKLHHRNVKYQVNKAQKNAQNAMQYSQKKLIVLHTNSVNRTVSFSFDISECNNSGFNKIPMFTVCKNNTQNAPTRKITHNPNCQKPRVKV
jgi:hypothetical protein